MVCGLECLSRSLAIREELGDQEGAGLALAGLAKAHDALGQCEKAAECRTRWQAKLQAMQLQDAADGED